MLAWAAIALLIAAALAVANRLGFAGLLVLGLLTAFVCGHAELQNDIPAAGTAIFQARMDRRHAADELRGRAKEESGFIASLRFFKWCGLGLALTGLIGFILRLWLAGT